MADVVIVDDDPDHIELLTEIMRLAGHTVRYGYNGEDGMRLVFERHPDLVLLDVEMPLLGGPAMAYRMFLKDMGLEHIPVILMSGVMDLPRIAARVGTPYYLAKPYRYPQLVAMVDRALAERVAPRPTGGEPDASSP